MVARCARGRRDAARRAPPSRSHLRHKFATWCDNLYKGIDVAESEKRTEQILIQEEGGHQNTFMFVERERFSVAPGAPSGVYAPRVE